MQLGDWCGQRTPHFVCFRYALFSRAISFSPEDGRRPMYLWGMPILCMGSFGVAASTSLRWLLFWRFVQAFGCAGGVSIGAAAIGDIYRVEQRGTAMGIFFGACLLGVALSPITGGTAAHYWSWRSLQWSLGLWGFIEMVFIYLFLPETSHSHLGGVSELTTPFNFVWINPFNSIWLLRSPNIMAVTLANASAMVTEYVLLIPIAYTIGARYHISNEALIGACFLPSGLGNFSMYGYILLFELSYYSTYFTHKSLRQLLGGCPTL